MDLSPLNVLGLAAGALVVATAAFVLAARPRAWLHRFFFALAATDGAGTILIRLRETVSDPATKFYLHESYWYFELVGAALILSFVVLFPQPLLNARLRVAALVGIAGVAVAAIASYVIDPALHWRADITDGRLLVTYGPVGVVEHACVSLTVLALAARLSFVLMRVPSRSHRRQAALFLAGYLLNQAAYATTDVATNLGRLPAYLGAASWYAEIDHVARLAATLGLIAIAVVLLRDREQARATERGLVLAALAGVLAITIAAFADPAAQAVRFFRILGVAAYPLVLGYAILRYELFDIDAHLRRAATISLSIGALTAVFIVAENTLQGVLQDTVLAGMPSAWVANSLSALATAALSVPVVKLSRRVGRRVVPQLTQDDLHRRKLEVYRHSVEGALADGIVVEKESRMLAALRESLGLTLDEHAAIVAEVRATAIGRDASAAGA